MSFEDEIRARIPSVIDEQQQLAVTLRDAQTEQASQQAERDKQWAAAEARVLRIGTESARLLLAANRPTLPVWEDRKFGKTIVEPAFSLSGAYTRRYRKTALKRTGEGWHIATVSDGGYYERPPSKTHYCLTTEGVFAPFDSTVISKYKNPADDQVIKVEGIIRPRPSQYPGITLRAMESDLFLNAIAGMVATGKTYKLHRP